MYEKPDFYSVKAKKEGYAARSVYKLIEINEKFKLFKSRQKILDLGSAPGSWAQYASKAVGQEGLVVGIDYKEIKVNLPNAIFITGSFLDGECREKIKSYSPFNGIISDMAPDTKGDKIADCSIVSDLVENVLLFSYEYLIKGGFFIAKVFQGGNEREIMKELKKAFSMTKFFKPSSCRKNSVEIYMIAHNYIKKPESEKLNAQILNIDNYDGTMPW